MATSAGRLLGRRGRVVASLLALLWQPLAFAASPEGGFDPHGVRIHVEHGIELPWGKPGFSVEVSGWMPNEELSLVAVSPSGEQVVLIPIEKPLRADENGDFGVDVDYGRKGFAPGHWVLMLAGKPGAHIFETDLPRVEPPTATRPKWRLDFGAPATKGKPPHDPGI